jgi:hypothetical protein
MVFDLAEVLRREEFLRADDLRAAPGGAADERELVACGWPWRSTARHLRDFFIAFRTVCPRTGV